MAFTVDDFHGLVRVLEARPEWRAELRRQVLTDELLDLPGVVRQLAEHMDQLTQRMDQLVAAQLRTETQLADMAGRLGSLDGRTFELLYASRAPAYFGDLARRIRVLDSTSFAHMLDEAADAGTLTQTERKEAIRTDIVLSGRRRSDGVDVYYVAELSIGVGIDDVRWAIERAAILAKLGRPAVPVVAGKWINQDAQAYASSSGVWQLLDGHDVLPDLVPPASG